MVVLIAAGADADVALVVAATELHGELPAF